MKANYVWQVEAIMLGLLLQFLYSILFMLYLVMYI
jgi:hypothetical protein